ncbi:MAG: hypothetical protein RLZZ15_803, partial [Verrucomicrobiota bacterium]
MTAPICRACGSAHVAHRGRKRGEFLRREFDFYACADCGLLFVEPFAGFEIYDDAYYRGQGPDPYVDYESEYRDWRRTDRGLEFDDLTCIAETFFSSSEQLGATSLAPASNPATRYPLPATRYSPLHWLDFGCGAGGFLKYLRERATLAGRPLALTGHDLGSYADLLARADRFRILDLAALEHEPAASYEIISMIEVVEHLPEPAKALALIARLLKPGGLLLLTTGNMAGPVARRQGIHYRYCAPEIHVSLFDPRSLGKLYAAVGLAPLAVRYDGVVRFKVVKSLRRRPLLR